MKNLCITFYRSGTLLLTLAIVVTTNGVSPGDGSIPISWPIQFVPDLQLDPRDQFKNGDQLDWQVGKLTVPTGAVFWREISAGPRVELEVDVKYSDDETVLTDFPIPYQGSKAIVVRFVRDVESSKTTIGVLEIDQRTRPATEVVLQQVALQGEQGPRRKSLSGTWRIIYRYGQLRVERDGQQIVSGYVRYHKSVAGLICLQKLGRFDVTRYELRALERESVTYSAQQQRDFDDAAAAMENAQAAFEADDMPTAQKFAELAHNGFKQILGADHPYDLKAAGVLALALGHSPDRHAESRQLLDDLLLRSEKVLGIGHPETADLWTRIAGNHLVNNDPAGALRSYKKAAEIYLEAEGPASYRRGIALIQLGYAASQCDDLETAERALIEAIGVLQQTAEPVVIADASRELASVLIQRRKLDEAKKLLEQSIKTYAELEHGGISHIDSILRLAEWYLLKEQLTEAAAAFDSALKIEQTRLGSDSERGLIIRGWLAVIAAERGNLNEALQIQQSVVRLAQAKFGDQSTLTARATQILAGIHHSRQEYDQAASLSQQVFEIELGIAKTVLPVVAEAEGIEYIQQVYSDRDDVLASMRRLDRTDAGAAYRILRQSRGLVSRFGDRIRSVSVADDRWRQLNNDLQQVRTDLAIAVLSPVVDGALVSALEEQKERLQRDQQRRAAELGVELPEIADDSILRFDGLTDETALVEFLKSNLPSNQGQLYDAFVIRRDAASNRVDVQWVQLGAAEPIEAAILGWRYGVLKPRGVIVERKPGVPMEQAAMSVRQQVWDKIQPYLAGIKHVIVVPDAEMSRVAWGALPDQDHTHVLLERYSFSTLTDSQSLASRYEVKDIREPASVLLVGGVDYTTDSGASSQQWSYLPGTAEEVKNVAAIVPAGWSKSMLTHDQPTPQAVIGGLSQAEYVLLASHGFGNDQQGWGRNAGASNRDRAREWLSPGASVRGQARSPLALSGIVLHRETTRRLDSDAIHSVPADRISGEMIAQLDLRRTKLVVLSACESGLGDVAGGEGVFGLQRAFEMAGTQTTIASLWNVPDEATTKLIVRFFDNHWNRRMGKLDALREAQLWLRSSPDGKTLPPYYWGAFILSGDWR